MERGVAFLVVAFKCDDRLLREAPKPCLTCNQAGDAVRLTMLQSHDRDISDDIPSDGRQDWSAILSSLKSVLETGKPLAIKMAPPVRMLAALKAMGIWTPG